MAVVTGELSETVSSTLRHNEFISAGYSTREWLGAEDIIVGDTLIVTGEEHRFLTLDQLREMPEISATLLLELVGRNTAPALTFAALQASDLVQAKQHALLKKHGYSVNVSVE